MKTKMKKNVKGFTLTEMIVVIAIIGILAAVMIPSLTIYISRARESSAIQNAITLHKELFVELDPTSDGYETLQGNKYYVVQVDKYWVLLENGAASEAKGNPVKGGKAAEAVGKLVNKQDAVVFVLEGDQVTKYSYNQSSWTGVVLCLECGEAYGTNGCTHEQQQAEPAE